MSVYIFSHKIYPTPTKDGRNDYNDKHECEFKIWGKDEFINRTLIFEYVVNYLVLALLSYV